MISFSFTPDTKVELNRMLSHLLEREHLIGRLRLLYLLERLSPYRDLREVVERRLAQAMAGVPPSFHEAALAVFGTVFYFHKQVLDDAWRHLWFDYCERINDEPRIQDLLVLELDRDTLRDDFYRVNALFGRLEDNLPIRSTYDLIDALIQIEAGQPHLELHDAFRLIVAKKHWLLLVDCSMSGGSVEAEVNRIQRLIRLVMPDSSPTLTALVQVATEPSLQIDCMKCVIRAIEVPLACALNSEAYGLIRDRELVGQMRSFCQWFAEVHVLPSGYRLAELSRESNDSDLARYGFGRLGWNVVLHNNTPNNSLPALWFRPPGGKYLPPFERIDSRIRKVWSGRREWLERVEEKPAVQQKIRDWIYS